MMPDRNYLLHSQKNRYRKESAGDVVIYALVSGEKYWPFLESLHIIRKQQGLRERMRVATTPHVSKSQSDTWFPIVSAGERTALRSLQAPSASVRGVLNAEGVWKGISAIGPEWLLPGGGGLRLRDPGYSRPGMPLKTLPAFRESSLAYVTPRRGKCKASRNSTLRHAGCWGFQTTMAEMRGGAAAL